MYFYRYLKGVSIFFYSKFQVETYIISIHTSMFIMLYKYVGIIIHITFELIFFKLLSYSVVRVVIKEYIEL